MKCKFCSEFGNNFPPTDVYNVGWMVVQHLDNKKNFQSRLS